MKLLIVADIFPPQAGGPATYAVTLANELAKQGVEVTVVSLNPQADKNVLDKKVIFHRVNSNNRRLRYFEFIWLLWLQLFKNDVVYAMGPVNAGWPAMWACRLHFLRKRKFIVKVVGDYAWEQGVVKRGVKESVDEFQNKEYPEFVGRLRAAERQTVKAADLVITPSEYLKKMVIGWGANAEKIKVIYNAVEFKDVPPAAKPAGERWIVSVGRLVPWKGMGTLIEIMPEILKSVPVAKLKIVGGGPEMESLKSKVQSPKLESVVELLGYKSHAETLSFIGAADVFVLNSGYEGLSHVILEALSFGKPVIASNVGGNPEIITKEIGDLFELNDKEKIKSLLLKYLQSHSLQDKSRPLSVGKLSFLHKFSIENMIAQTLSTINQLTN